MPKLKPGDRVNMVCWCLKCNKPADDECDLAGHPFGNKNLAIGSAEWLERRAYDAAFARE